MKIYTKTGDAGQTGLLGGSRVGKNDPRVAAYGDVDELNAVLGWATARCAQADIAERSRRIQSDLFTIGAELACAPPADPPTRLDSAAVERIEVWVDEACDQMPELRSFILPGGSELGARLHLARTVCRRAERAVVGLHNGTGDGASTIVYLNRLSDLLFAWARLANQRNGEEDVVWSPSEEPA